MPLLVCIIFCEYYIVIILWANSIWMAIKIKLLNVYLLCLQCFDCNDHGSPLITVQFSKRKINVWSDKQILSICQIQGLQNYGHWRNDCKKWCSIYGSNCHISGYLTLGEESLKIKHLIMISNHHYFEQGCHLHYKTLSLMSTTFPNFGILLFSWQSIMLFDLTTWI